MQHVRTTNSYHLHRSQWALPDLTDRWLYDFTGTLGCQTRKHKILIDLVRVVNWLWLMCQDPKMPFMFCLNSLTNLQHWMGFPVLLLSFEICCHIFGIQPMCCKAAEAWAYIRKVGEADHSCSAHYKRLLRVFKSAGCWQHRWEQAEWLNYLMQFWLVANILPIYHWITRHAQL